MGIVKVTAPAKFVLASVMVAVFKEPCWVVKEAGYKVVLTEPIMRLIVAV